MSRFVHFDIGKGQKNRFFCPEDQASLSTSTGASTGSATVTVSGALLCGTGFGP